MRISVPVASRSHGMPFPMLETRYRFGRGRNPRHYCDCQRTAHGQQQELNQPPARTGQPPRWAALRTSLCKAEQPPAGGQPPVQLTKEATESAGGAWTAAVVADVQNAQGAVEA